MKLSFKIGLVLVGIATLLVGVTFGIIRGAEVRNNDMMVVVYVIVPIILIALAVLLALAVHFLLIKRMRKLNEMAKEVASGNLDTRLEVKGSDELAQLMETFNGMTAELKANEYLSKEFVRNVSHEFKTPISSVKAYAELIQSESKKTKSNTNTIKEYSDIIIERSDRLTQLTRSVLQLSLLDSTTVIKKDDAVCVSEQVRNILRVMQKSWEDKNIELDLQLDDFTIQSNEQLLYQVWQNLISNAIKFSKPKGTISIIVRQDNDKLHCEIIDAGVGIKDEDKERIFNQFFVADKSRNAEGSGLGLPIVKKIIDKLGGTITFESKESQGSKFFVNLEVQN